MMMDLRQAEHLINGGTLAEQCHAMREVSKGRLYRPAFAALDDWAQARCGIGRAYAYRLIRAADVLDSLTGFPVQPRREAVVRPLVNLTHEQRRAVWQAVSSSGRRITSNVVREAARRVTSGTLANAE